ncbi:MAG: hypothetical protein HZC28_11730 [Spirochaetes bacterium]|nr:hypothetical protein [Spirochaetota bacterium]
MSITYRENMIRAMKRQQPEFVPFEYSFTAALADKIRTETGSDPYAYLESVHHHANIGTRNVGMKKSVRPNDYSRYYAGRTFENKVDIDEWGIGHQAGSFMHFTHMESPLVNASSLREIEDYPMPDCGAHYRWDEAQTQTEALHKDGYAVTAFSGHTFETVWQIRGMEAFLSDMYLNIDWCEALIEKVFNVNINVVRESVSAGIDVLRLGDDVGTQTGMMFSPEFWRRLFKPRLKAYIDTAKRINPSVLIWYHSDGDIRAIIPDLIEIGLDILNPVQPECMDAAWVKREYGRDLSFWGVIGTQQVMPFGTPSDVKNEIRRLISTVGENGGLCLAPTHVLEPEVPTANIKAMVEAVEEYGKY